MLIELGSKEFQEISAWPFTNAFVNRLLQTDIPLRMRYSQCCLWGYRDADDRLVGFGTLDVCHDCREFTDGKLHPYIPLLAVNRNFNGRGFGTSIVRHLIDQATLVVLSGDYHDELFLDVYATNTQAIHVYEKCGFVTVSPEPIPDPQEGGNEYLVMARRISIG